MKEKILTQSYDISTMLSLPPFLTCTNPTCKTFQNSSVPIPEVFLFTCEILITHIHCLLEISKEGEASA